MVVLLVTDNSFVNLNFHDRFLNKPQIKNFMKIHLLEEKLLHADRRQTDTTKIIAVLHKFCKCTKIGNTFWKLRLFLSHMEGTDVVP
jgi:hypothetical protein